MWLLIDERKILSGIKDLISEVYQIMHDIQTTRLLQVDKSAEVERNETDISKYTSIQKFGIPLVTTTVKSLLKDIVSLNAQRKNNKQFTDLSNVQWKALPS